MMREERSLKFKFESWPPIIGGIMKVKRANRLMSIIDEIWAIYLQKVDTLLMIDIYDKYFHFIPVIMVLYIYKYWFKMLKWWKFSPLIKARASSTNCTMGNLTCSRPTQHTYLQFMSNFARFISILLYKSLVKTIRHMFASRVHIWFKYRINLSKYFKELY